MISQKNRRFTQYLSILLTLLLLVTTVPTAVAADTNDDTVVKTTRVAEEVTAIQPNDKIAEDLRSDMQTGEEVEVIVYMKDKLDSVAFAQQATEKNELAMSNIDARKQTRRQLVLALQDQAHNTQYGLRRLVTDNRQVSEFKSYFIANVAYVKATPAVIRQIAMLPDVEKITPNRTYEMDPYIVEGEASLQEAEGNLWSLEMVRAPELWDAGIDGNGAVVGLLDTGTDYYHPALHDKWRGLGLDGTEDATYSWYDPIDHSSLPIDSSVHGTHVCGTMVGEDRDKNVKIGVAPGAKWIAARCFDTAGKTSDSWLLSAAEWMIAPGGNPDMAPDVVNNSWGSTAGYDDWYMEAVDAYLAADIVPVFSAGNRLPTEPVPGPGSIVVPSNYPNSLAVGAIDDQKLRGSFSKRGPSPYTDEWKPELSAPGVDILSSIPGGGYTYMSGTSMASPHVSGTIALMRAANKNLSAQEIRDTLIEYAEPLTDNSPHAQTSPNHDYGYGLIDAYQSTYPFIGEMGVFTGSVLHEGIDAGPPVIEHEQTAFKLYQGTAEEIRAFVTDDTTVTSVKLSYKISNSDWVVEDMKQLDGGPEGGTYVFPIDSWMTDGDNFLYKITAEDYVGNTVEVGPYFVEAVFGVTTGEYMESFEGEAEGWTMQPLWQIGSPSAEGEPEVPDGKQYVGTAIGANYHKNESALMTSAPIDMRNTADASVRFLQWHKLGTSNMDRGGIFVSNDYGQHAKLHSYVEFDSDGWEEIVIDLRPYAYSQEPVFVYFQFATSDEYYDLGWYIDRFKVEGKDETPPSAPTNLAIKPGLISLELSWDFEHVADFDKFEIYRSTEPGTDGVLVDTTTQQTWQDFYTDMTEGTDYYYTVKAVDIFGNVSEPSNEAIGRKDPAINAIVDWTFENDNGGFTKGQIKGNVNDWQWGSIAPTHGPGNAYAGNNVWGTGLRMNYFNNADAYLQTPQITLPADADDLKLVLNHWYHFEQAFYGRKFDYGQIHLRPTDSMEWINITPLDEGEAEGEGKFSGPPGTEKPKDWHYTEIDLNAYAGKTIELRFFYHTDDSGQRNGWFINDVHIVDAPQNMGTGSKLYPMEAPIAEEGEAETRDMTVFGTVEPNENDNNYVGAGVPVLDATVTVLETERRAWVDNRTGNYRFRHKASEGDAEWTLKAEAYGYYPEIFKSVLHDKNTVVHNFFLKEMEQADIVGRVYDRYNNEPVPYAKVKVVEDPNIPEVVADENGNYRIKDVYVGDYTLYAVANDYESNTVAVTVVAEQENTCDIPLKRFVGVGNEIIYDDGQHESAAVVFEVGGGIAMRFTPERFGKLMYAKFYFNDKSWPDPGGDTTGFGVFVDRGSGYEQIGATKVRDDIVRGEWYTIDLSDLNFYTDKDFYVTTIQTTDGDRSPGVGIDEHADKETSLRSYLYSDGVFKPFISHLGPGQCGMIRAGFEYIADTPVITNLEDVNYTNQDNIDVEGVVHNGLGEGPVLVYANGKEVARVQPEDMEDNVFKTNVKLTETETAITAALEVNGKATEPGPDKLVIKDTVAPKLEVTAPEDGEQVNVELVHVIGSTSDENFDKLLINGKEAEIAEDGSFDFSLVVVDGENKIEIRAIDKAGNETVEVRTVYVELGGIGITDMKPAEDIVVPPGATVEVSFRAPAGGTGSYILQRPTSTQSVGVTGNPMTEVEPGFYKAVAKTGDIEFRNASVVFTYTDAYGNTVKATAPGKISVVKSEIIDRLAGGSRYQTATKMSELMYQTAETVILASGEDFPDALVGGTLAEAIDAPVLLTKQAELPKVTLKEIDRLAARKVIILGGELAIGKDVEAELVKAGLETERIAGGTRYSTAVRIAARARKADSTHVFLAYGHKYEDALGIVPVAARQDDALLLTDKDKLSKATKDAMAEWNTETVTIMGGKYVVSAAVEKELKDLGYEVNRIQGGTRYSTNVDIAKTFFPDATEAVGASGVDFPDALVGSVYAAKRNCPVILLNPKGLDKVTVEYFEDTPIEHVLLMGGKLAIPEAVEYHILGILEDK